MDDFQIELKTFVFFSFIKICLKIFFFKRERKDGRNDKRSFSKT